MKKYVVFAFAALLLLTLAACGNEAAPAETTGTQSVIDTQIAPETDALEPGPVDTTAAETEATEAQTESAPQQTDVATQQTEPAKQQTEPKETTVPGFGNNSTTWN